MSSKYQRFCCCGEKWHDPITLNATLVGTDSAVCMYRVFTCNVCHSTKTTKWRLESITLSLDEQDLYGMRETITEGE